MKEKIENINVSVARKEGLVGDGEVSYEAVKDAIRNPENFAQRVDYSRVEIATGVFLESKTLELGDGHFTNVYDMTFNNSSSELNVEILTKQTPLYPHRLFTKAPTFSPFSADGELVACINGAFFFLQDEMLEKVPGEIIYNLNIREGHSFGLPAVTREVLYVTKDGRLHETRLEAVGTIEINGKTIEWIGGEPIAHLKTNYDPTLPQKGKALLFNSACCTIQYEDATDKTSLRKLRHDLNATPRSSGVTDVVVSLGKNGESFISEINHGGGTDFFSGNYILQIGTDFVQGMEVNQKVTPQTVGMLNLADIKSALSTGPAVHHFLENNDHEINHDPSLGTFPPFDPIARYARSVIYEDKTGHIHMVVFDAVPRSKKMKGVTPREVAENIPMDSKWAVFLDGGQSSRLTYIADPKEDSLAFGAKGNKQYVRLNERLKTSQIPGKEDQFIWSTRGRPLSSMILLRKKRN